MGCGSSPTRVHIAATAALARVFEPKSIGSEVIQRVTQVILREGESFDNLLKRFRKKMIRSRILSEVKKKRYYVSDSEKRHRALRKAVNRERKRQRKVERRLRRA